MSKGRGKKIAIKFDKALLGDVSGNEGAFTITGLERDPLFYGEPALREYAVEEVERYPLTVFWRDDFSGAMNGTETNENGIIIQRPERQVFTESGIFTIPDGVTEVDVLVVGGGGGGGSRQGGGGGGAGGLIFEQNYDVSEESSIIVTIGAGGAGGASTAAQKGQNGGDSVFGTLTAIGGGGGGQALASGDTSGNAGGSGGGAGRSGTANDGGNGTAGQGNSGGANTGDNDHSGGGGGAGAPGANATSSKSGDGGNGLYLGHIFGDDVGDDGWFAGGGGGGPLTSASLNGGQGGKGGGGSASPPGNGGNGTPNTGGGGGGASGSGSDGNFAGGNGGSGVVIIRWNTRTLGTYISSPIDTSDLPEMPRIRFDTDTPTGTSITAEYATNNSDTTPPETWTAVSESDLFTIDGDFLWLRYTLETEDTSKTPTLLSVWLEEAEAPPDTIILTMTEAGLFRDVEGDITVAYDQSVGNLTGTRPVASFEHNFTPVDLEPTPVHEHIITARGIPVVHLLPYNAPPDPDYESGQSPPHAITVTAGPINIAFIHVQDIPP